MIEESLLGFDARELWLNPDDLWDAARREAFLLSVGVAKPLSTDSMVWPSVFDTGQGLGLPESERTRLCLAGLPSPRWIGANAGLWESLGDMRRHLAERWTDSRPHAVIAVSWLSDDGFASAGRVGPHREPTAPAAREAHWRLLGLDIADGSLLSGLSNCGYSQLEVEELRRRWEPHLNRRHLFADPARAFEFRDLANTRVPEHAPFFVYGLYLIEEVSWLWIRWPQGETSG